MVKLLAGALLALTAVNSVAGNLYIYKDKDGKVLTTIVNPSGGLVPNVKVTEFDENDKVTKIRRYNVKQVRKATAQSGDYSPEAYESKFTFIDEKNYSDKRNITYKSNGVQIGE